MAKKTIMVVDDEKNLLTLLKEILEMESFRVITADNGIKCLNKLKKVKPDLIVMDLMMPKMDGFQTIKEIRKNPKTKDIKIVVLTVSKVAEESKFQLSKFNISEYIDKPFDIIELVNKIKKIV